MLPDLKLNGPSSDPTPGLPPSLGSLSLLRFTTHDIYIKKEGKDDGSGGTLVTSRPISPRPFLPSPSPSASASPPISFSARIITSTALELHDPVASHTRIQTGRIGAKGRKKRVHAAAACRSPACDDSIEKNRDRERYNRDAQKKTEQHAWVINEASFASVTFSAPYLANECCCHCNLC